MRQHGRKNLHLHTQEQDQGAWSSQTHLLRQAQNRRALGPNDPKNRVDGPCDDGQPRESPQVRSAIALRVVEALEEKVAHDDPEADARQPPHVLEGRDCHGSHEGCEHHHDRVANHEHRGHGVCLGQQGKKGDKERARDNPVHVVHPEDDPWRRVDGLKHDALHVTAGLARKESEVVSGACRVLLHTHSSAVARADFSDVSSRRKETGECPSRKQGTHAYQALPHGVVGSSRQDSDEEAEHVRHRVHLPRDPVCRGRAA